MIGEGRMKVGVYELVVQDKMRAMEPKVIVGTIQDSDAEG